ncbi:MAG: hypothetical protein RDU25_00275 [Patescibacteria group bacterium]|nr:hypothetical protein [Patescibacteria group bacterium]
MAIKGKDREFRLRQLSYIDFKPVNMDRVLTMLFPRLRFGGYGTRRPPRKNELTVSDFTREYVKDPKQFAGFAEHQNLVERWIETDLMDMVNRGRPNQALAAPRPLHGNTYKFRNARHARDYGAAEQLYWMLYYARGGRGQVAREALTRFFFPGVDLHTDKYDPSASVDVETQALLHFDQQVSVDMRDSQEPERFPPPCVGQVDLLADDTLRLLAYEPYIPRTVLVEYLKTLFAFHLGLYHLRLIKLLPALVRRRSTDPTCDFKSCPVAPDQMEAHGGCPYRVYLLADLGNDLDSHMAALARHSADVHYRRIPTYVQSHYLLRKLDELADYLSHRVGKLSAPANGFFGIGDLLALLEPPHAAERDGYFKARLAGLLEDTGGNTREEIDPEIKRVTEMGLGDLDMYVEILMALRGSYHRRYITEFLDSVFKRGDAGVMHQSKASPRRFAVGSQLLEVLLQIAVLRSSGSGFYTRALRIDELLVFLRERYGIYIDRLPPGDGFGAASIKDLAALRQNVQSFRGRLREIGFFRDLSDAYITQTVMPRYTIEKTNGGAP